MDNVTYLAAFGAGIASFASPCVLPLVPAYLSYISGASLEDVVSKQREAALARVVAVRSVAFVLGFSAVFVALGASVGAVGYVVRDHLPTIEKVAGVLLIVLGLNLLGILRIPWLYRTYQIDFPSSQAQPGAG